MKKLKIKQKSNRTGFTLVELVIVIAIVIILSVISVPIYRGYVDKAKLAEGYALLGQVLSAQKAYCSEYGYFYKSTYTHGPSIGYYDAFCKSYDTVLGIDARGNKYFSTFCNSSAYSDEESKSKFLCFTLLPEDLRTDNKTFLRIKYDGSPSFYFI